MVRIPAVSISRARENGRRHSRAFSITYLKSGYSVCEEDLYETELHRLAHTEHPMSILNSDHFVDASLAVVLSEDRRVHGCSML